MIMNIEEMRRFTRYTVDMPIKCGTEDGPIEGDSRMQNVSKTGLSFTSKTSITPGSNIRLQIAFSSLPIELTGTVMWCHDMDNYNEMGVKFSGEKTTYSMLMIEQLCLIEQYRQQVKETEGRDLNSKEACKEWIKKFAPDSPD
ncbi:MAG: PilZ domain-containing protein [Gammaproteobacteria bacterium]|nr:PilZ domain-containing protein [Gammaproteobacteria bacterium]